MDYVYYSFIIIGDLLMLGFYLYSYIASSVSKSTHRKIFWKLEYPEIENELYKWFQLQWEYASISTNISREKVIKR